MTYQNPTSLWEPEDEVTNLEENIVQMGTLSEETVVSSLCDLIKNNAVFRDRMFFRDSLPLNSFQKVTIQLLCDHKFNFLQAIRGSAKSYIIARALLGIMLAHKTKVVLTGPTFRQALHVFNYISVLIQENSGPNHPFNLMSEVIGNITIGTMEARIKFKNGSILKVLPMSDGTRIRGERANILVFDEAFMLEKTMYSSHILPFLQQPKVKGGQEPKLILATSAENQECYVYTLLQKWLKKIDKENDIVAKNPNYKRKYVVIDWNIDDIRACGMQMEDDVIEEILNGASDQERERVLYNKWISMAGQFFPANMIEKMRNKDVFIEHEAAAGFTYGLSVDVATQKDGDAFVIHVWKFLGDRKAAIVNTYWQWGQSADEMAAKIHKVNDTFHPRWIMMDSGGGGLYVANSLSKRKIIDRNGKETIIENPILMHDEENGQMKGTRKLILNKPNDPLVRAAFSGLRSRSGEEIKTYDVFVHLLYDGLKNQINSIDPCIYIPDFPGDEGDEDRSDLKIYDQIQESVYQMRFLTVKMIENTDGTKVIARSKTAKVPLYTWKTSNKDGASAFAYGYILYLLHYMSDRGGEEKYSGPRVQPNFTMYDEAHFLRGYVEDPSQTYNPFAAANQEVKP